MKRFLPIFLLFLPFLTFAQGERLLDESFDIPSDSWTQKDGERAFAQIQGGKYVLKHFEEKGTGLFWHSGVGIDAAYDFEILAEMALTAGEGDAFGLIWGAADAGNFFALNISTGNRFRVYKYADRKFSPIKDWSPTNGSVKGAGKVNQVRIAKKGAELIFILNDKEQFRTPFQSFFGNKTGFILYGKTEVNADNFQVVQDKNLPVLFSVKFDESPKDWFESHVAFDNAIFADGLFLLQGQSPIATELRSVDINTDQDFEISMHAMLVDGSEDKGYGLVWGAADSRDFYSFMVTNMGAYRLSEWENGNSYHLIDWTPTDQILGVDGDRTKLTLKKVGDYFTFYLNDKLLYKADFADFFGNKIGFVAEDSIMVAVDDVTVRQGMKLETFAAPGITWFTPVAAHSTLYRKKAVIEAGINSTSELGTVSLYLNGNLIRKIPAAQLPAENGYSAILSQEIDVKSGENEIKMVVQNTNGTLTEESRTILVNVMEQEEKKEGTDYALLFATDEYDYWTDLVNPVNDAKTIAEELEKHYGYTVELVLNPTRKDVLKKLKEYAKREYHEMDQLMIFFAGHGKFDPYFGEGYVVCTNSLKDDEGNDTYISHSSLRTIVNNIPSEHVFLVMDVCFGGTIDPFIAQGGHRGGGDQYKELSETEFIKRKMRFKTRKYLTSGGKEYVPDGTPGQHSPFARKFLEALRNYGGHDKILTLSEMLIYFERVIPEPRFGEFGLNQPGSDFLFIAK